MKIRVYVDKTEVQADARKGILVIETFLPSTPDEKSILIKGLEGVIAFIQTKF